MAFKRGNTFYVDITPHGYGRRIGPLSTRTKRRSLAESIEATIREFGTSGRHDLLDGVREGKFSVTELHASKVKGTLKQLLTEAHDPPLHPVISAARSNLSDLRYGPAFDRLESVAPDSARLSWLDDPKNIMRVVRTYRRDGLSPATERREMAGLSKLVRKCLGESRRREIFREVSLRRPDKGRTRWLTSEEIQRMKQYGGDWWPLIGLAIATGLRRGEIFALQVCDLNFEAGTLVVQHGKSVKARRMVPLAGEILTVLEQWVDANELEASDPLFPGVTKGSLRYAWERIREAADIEDVRFHDLRHTYAVHCAKAGMPLVELQQRLGHEKIDTTMRYAIYSPPVMSPHHQLALEGLGLA